MTQAVVLPQPGVLGLSQAVVGKKLVSRGAAHVVDKLDDCPDVIRGIVDALNNRRANGDVDLGKRSAQPSEVLQYLTVRDSGHLLVLVGIKALDVEKYPVEV